MMDKIKCVYLPSFWLKPYLNKQFMSYEFSLSQEKSRKLVKKMEDEMKSEGCIPLLLSLSWFRT